MVPKRRSQTAYSILHSAANHRLLMPAGKLANESPVGFMVELEEGPEEEFFFRPWQVKEEVFAAAPDAV
jgi:hypothetical protein